MWCSIVTNDTGLPKQILALGGWGTCLRIGKGPIGGDKRMIIYNNEEAFVLGAVTIFCEAA